MLQQRRSAFEKFGHSGPPGDARRARRSARGRPSQQWGEASLSLNAPPPFLDLLALPRPLVFAIFALLPVDTRLRCSEVSRAWRALLSHKSFWENLDLSVCSGLRYFSASMLRAAVAKAGGQLRALDVTGQPKLRRWDISILCTAVAANATTRTELRVFLMEKFENIHTVEVILEAAPAVKLFEASVSIEGSCHSARAMLRKKPPFQAL